MKRATNPKSPAKSRHTATSNTTDKHERDQEQTKQQPQQHHQQQQPLQNQPFYCPTDETDLTIGDQQQVSLLDPRESSDGRQQSLSVKGTSFTFAANMIGGKKTDNGDQAHQQQAKKQSGQKKKNILGAGDGADEDLESNSDSRAPGRTGKCWVILILMGITAALFVLVITLFFTVNLLRKPEEGDKCPDINQPFQASSYRLFATKTRYISALNYLSLVPLNAANSLTPTAASLVSISPDSQPGDPSAQQQLATTNVEHVVHYDRSSVHRPHFFWHNETLQGVHDRLSGPDFGCEAKQLHYYGRHAARYPSKRELERMSNAFLEIKKRIDLIISPSTAAEGLSENTNATKPACFDPLLRFSNWRLFAQPKQANLLTSSGVRETDQIASRLKNLYPHLFDASKTKISIGTTKKIRTAQTAVNFLKHLTNYNPDVCPLNDFLFGDADSINSNNCYANLIHKYKKDELSFHTGRCAVSIDEKVKFELNKPALTDWITRSVSESLKLDKPENSLKFGEMKAIYDMCKYETAISDFSIWCSLFTEQQMKFMEYMEDLKTYMKVAYGDSKQYESACILTKELMDRLGQYTGANIPEQQSSFYFTHSKVIQKIIASSIALSAEDAYINYETKLKSHDVPKERGWQTSLLSPFSANIAFILYSCPTRAAPKSDNSNNQAPGYNQFDVSRRHSRIVVALNEQPLVMSVSSPALEPRPDVPVDLFYSSARFTRNKECSRKEMCLEEKDAPITDPNTDDDDDDEDVHRTG